MLLLIIQLSGVSLLTGLTSVGIIPHSHQNLSCLKSGAD